MLAFDLASFSGLSHEDTNVSLACSKSIYALILYPALGLSMELSW